MVKTAEKQRERNLGPFPSGKVWLHVRVSDRFNPAHGLRTEIKHMDVAVVSLIDEAAKQHGRPPDHCDAAPSEKRLDGNLCPVRLGGGLPAVTTRSHRP